MYSSYVFGYCYVPELGKCVWYQKKKQKQKSKKAKIGGSLALFFPIIA